MTRYRIGCTGWGYDDWRGGFYAPGTPQSGYLAAYARVFDVTEVDSSYYHAPSPSQTARWARVTPDDFLFSVKCPGDVTHKARLVLTDALEPFERFLNGLEPLRVAGKLGPLVVQLPHSFTRTDAHHATLERFLAGVPREYRAVVELRHESWWVPETRAMLEDARVPLVWSVNQYAVTPPWLTGDFVYARFIGDRKIETFDRVQRDMRDVMERWKKRFEDEGASAREVFVMLNNHFMGFAPETARVMREVLGEPPVDLTAAQRGAGQASLGAF